MVQENLEYSSGIVILDFTVASAFSISLLSSVSAVAVDFDEAAAVALGVIVFAKQTGAEAFTAMAAAPEVLSVFSYYDLLSDDFRIFVSDNNTNHIRKFFHFKSKKYRFVILHNFSNDICALLMRLIFR